MPFSNYVARCIGFYGQCEIMHSIIVGAMSSNPYVFTPQLAMQKVYSMKLITYLKSYLSIN